jgi:hypothetical protein
MLHLTEYHSRKGHYCSSVTAHYNEFLIWCKANVITSLSEFISVFKQPTLSVVFRSFFLGFSVIVLILQTIKMSSSSSNVPKKGRGGRGGVPPPSIFPKVVYPVKPGSPAGIQPPAANTFLMTNSAYAKGHALGPKSP